MSTWEEKFNGLQSKYESMQNKMSQYDSLQNKFTSIQQQNESMKKELEQLKQDKKTKTDQIYHGIMLFIDPFIALIIYITIDRR